MFGITKELENIIRNNVKFDASAPWGYVVYLNKHIPHGRDSINRKLTKIEKFAEKNNGYCKSFNDFCIVGDNLTVHIEMNCDCVAAKAFDAVVEEKEKPFIYISINKDGVWSSSPSVSRASNHAIRFCEEKDYPVDLFYMRSDINGSSSIEKETCAKREDLIKTLNWIGECGFIPLKLWGFNIETSLNEKVLEVFAAGSKARADKLELSLDEKIADAVAMGKKEYPLVLCKGEQDEERVQAYLTDEEVVLIKRDLAGELNTGMDIELTDGRNIEVGIVDEITMVDKEKACSREER